jgi:two-component system sensor histidine kinase AlgZ
LLIKKLTEQSKHSLKKKVNKAKLALFTQCKENLIAILLVFTTLISLILMLSAIGTRENRIAFTVTLLSINFLLLLLLIIANNPFKQWLLDLNLVKKDSKAEKSALFFLTWLYNHNIAFSFLMAFSTISIFEAVGRINMSNMIYNFTITFSFALILYRIVLFIKEKTQHQPQSLDLKTQNIYMIYASFIALSFVFSTTVDNSDYGTQFQLTVLSWVMLFHLLSHWMTGQWKLVKQLKNERNNAELMHLKSQVNPHFLFNTLNNLYGLALEKSDQTPGLILKLSDMLRYTIYQGKKDRVLLKDEINYLNDFIQLQQIRYHKPVNITFSHEIEESGLMISPLLLLILLENAYKHGVEKLTEEAFIIIKLEAKQQKMVFEIENNFDKGEQSSNTGIGLQNLKQRLKLIYPDSHQLDMASENGVYSVRLEIQLGS